ncbi:hypothetical protein NHP190012_15470 [Helicobacter sp. NHP19-012]|uniref:Glycosyltransferase 2-like domain-containing protein n=1 Tax=Helicobacter gastrofelis TaxID=2849642 RepID=A0ABM7SG83_9HELI|nr:MULTISPECIES: glycosyltransferase [unclassified Helicobacter]BCZ19905.1 hypothetical protein NHP190012_15470 [Helicobacter sp. NHP19-012]GMB95574.1 hypothetical protein NHP22001_01630 [Helicobacter sp. NHP22-001]
MICRHAKYALPVEHLILDGGSTDNMLEILKAHSHLQVFNSKDKGLYGAMNKSIFLVNGEIVGILK